MAVYVEYIMPNIGFGGDSDFGTLVKVSDYGSSMI